MKTVEDHLCERYSARLEQNVGTPAGALMHCLQQWPISTEIPDILIEAFSTMSQHALLELQNAESPRRASVETDGAEDEIFVLTPGWGISVDGDRYWTETMDGKWHVHSLCDLPTTLMRCFAAEFDWIIRS